MVTQILGPDGQPIKRQTLTQEIVTPSVTGVRHLFDEFVASGLTPARLAAILRDAAQGEMEAFLTLAEEMEEREGQYASQLRTRKTAIKSIIPQVRAAKRGDGAQTLADAVHDEVVDQPGFKLMLANLLDALGKGYSAVEIIWDLSEKQWGIADYKWRDPRLFHFDRETRRELRIRTLGNFEGMPLPPAKFLVHTPELKSGLPARNGLARIAVWHFMLKSYTLKDWASFIELHGLPLRLGKYPQGASKEDKAVLFRAVRNLGSDAAAIIPAGMEIEFVQVHGFSEKPFEGMAKYLDAQLSKIIIGQTMTADDGSSLGQAAVHDKVRIDIKEDDAAAIEHTINRHLIRPWVDFNFGPRKPGEYPQIVLPTMEREDLKAYADGVTKLVDRGLEIDQDEVRDRIGHRHPEAGAKLLRPARSIDPAEGPPPEAPAAPPAQRKAMQSACPACGEGTALNAADLTDELDRLSADALGDWEKVMEPMRDQLADAFTAATDYDDLNRRLDALAATLDTAPLARSLAIAMMKARGAGAANGPQAKPANSDG